jgi:hypothetical protein
MQIDKEYTSLMQLIDNIKKSKDNAHPNIKFIINKKDVANNIIIRI